MRVSKPTQVESLATEVDSHFYVGEVGVLSLIFGSYSVSAQHLLQLLAEPFGLARQILQVGGAELVAKAVKPRVVLPELLDERRALVGVDKPGTRFVSQHLMFEDGRDLFDGARAFESDEPDPTAEIAHDDENVCISIDVVAHVVDVHGEHVSRMISPEFHARRVRCMSGDLAMGTSPAVVHVRPNFDTRVDCYLSRQF